MFEPLTLLYVDTSGRLHEFIVSAYKYEYRVRRDDLVAGTFRTLDHALLFIQCATGIRIKVRES